MTSPALAAWRSSRLARLDRLLHAARNGVVHDDLDKLAHVQAEGWAMDIASVVRWRNQLDETVTALPDVVITAIYELLGDIR
jgi:hypothetical protein